MKPTVRHLYELLIKCLSIAILTLSFHTSFGQLINSDQAPPSVQWSMIETANFNLIYPIELSEAAQRVGNILENTMLKISENIGIKPRKINIVLQNRNVEGNGYVQLAPRKSEFYTTPPQDSDPADWLETLAIHEYRHVVQIDKLTGNIRFPFEELGFAFFGIALPTWFYEGDAVTTETLLTKGGRGRIPSWEMAFRANILEDKNYSYVKNYLGSLKDVTPGYYNLGYFMTTKLRRDYGEESLDSLLTRIAKNPIRPYNFSRSLKKITDHTSRHWHDKIVQELREIWQEQQAELSPETYDNFFASESKFPTAFRMSQASENGSILTLKISPRFVNSIVQIDTNGRIKELVKTGRQASPHFSYSSNKIVWDEVRADGRFKLRSYSVINTYNLITQEYRQLTRNSRLFSPSLNSNGSKIAAVEVNFENKVSLVIINADSGKEVIRIPSPQNRMLADVSFGQDDQVLAVTRNSDGTGLIRFSLPDQSSIMLIDKQTQQIENPTYAGNNILFKAHYNGIDNLYLLNPNSGSISQLTNTKYGAFDPSYDPLTKQVYFSNYDGQNFEISKLTLDKHPYPAIDYLKNTFTNYYKPLQEQTPPLPAFDTGKVEIFQEKPYKTSRHLFNFHSLSINNGDYDDLDNYKPGLFILSNNIMNTMATRLGFTYDPDQHGLDFHSEIQFNRYFPRISLGYDNLSQLSNVFHPPDSTLHAVRWRENVARVQVEIPYTFNRLNHNYSFNFRVGTSYTQRYNISTPLFQDRLIKKIEFPLHYQLTLSRSMRSGQLDLAPRWGQTISVGLRHLPFSGLEGFRKHLQSIFYFPGLLPNHSTQIRFNAQHREGLFTYDNVIPMVSGFDQLRPTRPQNTFFLNYKFPFAYPDFEIGSLLYVKRLKATIFSDFEDIGMNKSFHPRTLGVDVRADVNLLRFLLPNFDLGVKTIYINENNPKRFIFQYSMSYSY